MTKEMRALLVDLRGVLKKHRAEIEWDSIDDTLFVAFRYGTNESEPLLCQSVESDWLGTILAESDDE